MLEQIDEAPPRQKADAAFLARRIGELAPLPRALMEALRVLGRDQASAAACVDAIERDPALAARVLRLANSGFYGASKRIASIGDAVQLLGLRTVAGVLAAASLRGVLGRMPCSGLSFEVYWRHSLGTAVAARELASCVGMDPNEAFIAGLLHDIGRWMMAVFWPHEMASALALAREREAGSCSAEARFVGMAHDELGAQVALHWNFPAATLGAIAGHHQPPAPAAGERATLVSLVHVADAMAHALDIAGDPQEAVPPVDAQAWQALGLSDESLLKVLQRTEECVVVMAMAAA